MPGCSASADRRPQAPEGDPPVVCTVGTSTRSLDEFVALLAARGIDLCLDTRRFPTSTRFPHFARAPLEAALRARGIQYVWMGQTLGGYRTGGYEAHMATPLFHRGLEEAEALLQAHRGVILCSERFPWRCHRRFVARALAERGWRVVHLIDRDRTWEPKAVGRRA
ncbi:MAG: DUF488 domain-containing protein [Armatimonadota bacterium]|nr:DUF488 domain-containing protein [Armatimonadota bacterium]